MLGKLIKHEFKAQVRLYGSIYLFGLIVSVIALICNLVSEANPNVVLFSLAKEFTFGIVVFILVALFIGTLIFAIIRYRNNLLKDEGYLMHTLPVNAWSLIASKMITSVCWFAGDVVAAYLLMAITTHDFTSFFSTINEGATELSTIGINKGWMPVFLLVIFLMATVSSLSQFYVSLSIGYSTYLNKDVMSFVVFIVLYFIRQIISFFAIAFGTLIYLKSIRFTFEMMNSDTPPAALLWTIMISTLVITVVITVVEFLVSTYFMNKKLNLE